MDNEMPQDSSNNSISFEELQKMPQLDLIPTNPYSNEEEISQSFDQEAISDTDKPPIESVILNTPEDMQFALEDLKETADENDEYLYYLYSNQWLKQTYPFLHDEDDPEETVAGQFVNEFLKIKLQEQIIGKLEDKYGNYVLSGWQEWFPVGNVSELYNQRFEGPWDLKGDAEQSTTGINKYNEEMANINSILNTIIAQTDSIINDEDNKNLNSNTLSLWWMKERLINRISKDEALLKALSLQLTMTSLDRKTYETQIPLQTLFKMSFWKNFGEEGYNREKALAEKKRRGESL